MTRKMNWYKSGISAAIAMTMMAGCSGGGGAEPQSPAPAASGAKENGGAKPSLKVLGFNVGFDPNNDPVGKDIEARTGYKVAYSMLPKDKPDEKLNIEIASGTEYDILALTPTQFYTLVAQGALQPLDELVNKHGANMKKAISASSWELGKYNGKLYGIPQKNERPNIDKSMIVRQDILDELGLKMPETLDEFYTTLKTIKAKKPDMIPLTGSGKDIFVVYSAFGLYTDWVEINGQLLPRIKQPAIKDYMAFMKKLYVEGLIDKDWAVNKSTQAQEKFVGGKAALIPGTWNDASSMNAAFTKNVPSGKMNYMPPLKGPDGKSGVQMEDRLLYVHAIPKSSKQAEAAIQFMDLKLQMDNFTFFTLGEKGVTFNEENGVYSPIMPIFTEKRGNAYWFLNGIHEKDYADMWLARLRRTPTLFEAFNIMNKNIEQIGKQNPIAFMPPIEAVGKNLPSLTQKENDYFLKVLLDGEKIENFDKFMTDWDNSGGSEVVKAVNDWYKTTKK
ncbi:putative aldouronate transport system substrate-binding protein [Paenibacillus sp. UNCCL117]|uniref:extracellular solute-binding protein n=1 Tax=unclassified Paenibacillus TaxID=185978 RepID=UPI00088364CC|nr:MULTISPECIES: extracellular solute-binding protein [unclassified Paenibacillus]SDD69311.1 putative aldouronate transport system substrate-binding protein [Paenibacillus sp. cl123]SFW45117.1 putative aldouronate transport system substrate-binding protein [Paenibacillus sp. UNCCL117]